MIRFYLKKYHSWVVAGNWTGERFWQIMYPATLAVLVLLAACFVREAVGDFQVGRTSSDLGLGWMVFVWGYFVFHTLFALAVLFFVYISLLMLDERFGWRDDLSFWFRTRNTWWARGFRSWRTRAKARRVSKVLEFRAKN